jgi:hypothetical protein
MKIRGKGIVLMMLVAVFCATALAQDDNTPRRPMPPRSIARAKMPPPPQPSPEMTKLIQMMSGNWTVTEKYEQSPMFPGGGTSKGTAKLWAGPGGLALLQDYHSSGVMSSNFSGSGTIWWDPKIQGYRVVWCDSMTPNGCDAGTMLKWDAETLTGTSESDMNGQKMFTRFTYGSWSPTSFVMSMSMGPDANQLKEMVTITYTKAATGAKTGQ